MKYVLSYGAGVNSTALMMLIKERSMPLDLVLFADTGEESTETYATVEYYRKICPAEFVVLKSPYGDKLYDYYLNKRVTPSRMKRDCTTKFKIVPMRRYLRARYGKKEKFIFYIGIDYGEMHRMKDADVKYIRQVYPLVYSKMNRESCQQFLIDRNLPVPPKSGCWMCPFTKKQGWLDMLNNEPEMFQRAIQLELANPRYPESVSLLSNIPLLEIKKRQEEMVDVEPSCDVSGACFS